MIMSAASMGQLSTDSRRTFEDASDLALASAGKAGVVSVAIAGGAIGEVVVRGNLVAGCASG